MKSIIKIAAMNAGLTALYIVIVAGTMFYIAETRLGQAEPSVFIPIFMLMLFVFSATITGTLMLGRPILWYVEGKKKEAVQLFGYTIGFFFALLALALSCLIIVASL